MISQSHFRQLAHLITVGDICSPFLAMFNANQSVKYVECEWVETCGERGLAPMEQIALVVQDRKILGWVGYDMLIGGKNISDCIEQIEPETIMTADTSLVEVVPVFSITAYPFFLILKGHEFIGWLSYADLHKPPFRLCLFAMLINVERILLKTLSLFPAESVACLSKGRMSKARKIYKLRQYKYDSKGEPFESKLLECTTIADKIHIARKIASIKREVPALGHSKLCKSLEPLRNEIAHPGSRERSSSLLKREKLLPFIEWLESVESELECFHQQEGL